MIWTEPCYNSLEDLKKRYQRGIGVTEYADLYAGSGAQICRKRGAHADGACRAGWGENPKFEETFAEFKKYYGEHCLDHTKPYPDIMHLLTELKARGVKTAIVSNKLDSAVKELDERFFRGI